ncbi:hypothetical protein HDU78_010995 [Chytriomyces hyalinus]|nr:hypothetical protein HDU78_010995 [Chytriomyces hyalinus]
MRNLPVELAQKILVQTAVDADSLKQVGLVSRFYAALVFAQVRFAHAHVVHQMGLLCLDRADDGAPAASTALTSNWAALPISYKTVLVSMHCTLRIILDPAPSAATLSAAESLTVVREVHTYFDFLHFNETAPALFLILCEMGHADAFLYLMQAANTNVENARLRESAVEDPQADTGKSEVPYRLDYSAGLGLCSEQGHTSLVEQLLKQPDVDPSQNESYCLRMASENGHEQVVALLVQDGRADANAVDNAAIRFAARSGHARIVQILLRDTRCDARALNSYALVWASRKGHCDTVRVLINANSVNVSADDDAAFRAACEYGHVHVAQFLLQTGAVDPSADMDYAIKWACRNGHEQVVRLLLGDPRVDPTADFNYPIRWAAEKGNMPVIKLLAHDSRISFQALPVAVRWASRAQQTHIVNYLVDTFGLYDLLE